MGNSVSLNPVVMGRWFRNLSVYYTLVLITSIGIVSRHHHPDSCWQLFGAWAVATSIIYLINTLIIWVRIIHREQQPTRCARYLYQLVDVVYLALMVWGHINVFRDSHCASQNPTIYNYSVFLLLHNYALLVAFLCLTVLYFACLPCFICLVRPLLEKSRGLSRQQIRNLPRKLYRDLPPPVTATSCSVCLEDFRPEDRLITIPCGHLFHEKCLSDWLEINAICPLCRAPVGVAEENA